MKKIKFSKKKISFWGGVAGLTLGFYMIFITKDMFGFLPAIAGSLLLIKGGFD